VEIATQVLTWFANLDGGTQAFILTILGLVAAISPIAGIISTITGLAAALNVAMLPMIATVGGIVVGIGLLVAAGVALYQNWDTVKQKASELWQKITETFNNIKETVLQAVEKIKGAFNFSWSLPPIKLPHFHVSGGEPPWGLMGKGSLPKISIDWYKKAYQNAVTFSTPTILATAGGLKGFGDGAGGETVVGNALLAQLIRENSGASTLEHISALLEVIARDGTTVTLQGDARQMFKQVRRQNANFAKSTGKSGFDY
jgi:hypothetical protein